MDGAFVVHLVLQMPLHFYNSWHSVPSLDLRTNFGLGAASWSHSPHFLRLLCETIWVLSRSGSCHPDFMVHFSPSLELNSVGQNNLSLIFSIRATPTSVTQLVSLLLMIWPNAYLLIGCWGCPGSEAYVAKTLLLSQVAIISSPFFPIPSRCICLLEH